jgi:hypothetical protein
LTLALAACLLLLACSEDAVEPEERPATLSWKTTASGTEQSLWTVVGDRPDNVFAFGDIGTIRRFNGEGWTVVTEGGGCNFRDSWRAPSGNMYAVGSTTTGCILVNDGSGWEDLGGYPGGYLFASIWGFSDDDIFLAGTPSLGTFGARVIRWDGNVWTTTQVTMESGFNDLWGSSSLDVFAVGGIGMIYHFDGSGWSEMTSPTSEALFGVLGFGPRNVYAFGDGGTILHYDGQDWVVQTTGLQTTIYAGWGPSPNDFFAVGFEGVVLHHDATAWQVMESNVDFDLFGVFGTSGSNVFAVGIDGGIIRYSPD